MENILFGKLRAFVAVERSQGNERCSVRPSSALSDVVYLHVDDTSLSFSFLSRLSQAVSPKFEIFSGYTDKSTSFDIQFILD